MEDNKEKAKRDILIRLKKIEGQVKGIEKMVETDNCCKDILVQIAAVRSAINKVGGLVLENTAKGCIFKDNKDSINSEEVDELIKALMMFLK